MNQVAIINFSGRRQGNCHGIVEFIKKIMIVGCEITVKEMYSLNITPCGKCDYECFNNNADCPHENDDILDIYNTICSSDLAFYIVPITLNTPMLTILYLGNEALAFF